MVDAVNSIGTGATVSPVAQQVVRAPASTPDVAPKAVGNAAVASSQTQSNVLTGRLFEDPQVGIVVSQTLDTQGYIVQQTPSSSVLAYLRNGLTVDGLPKATTTA